MAETTTRKPRSLALVLLAAGKGKRLKSETPKVLHPVGGRAMLDRVLDTLEAAGIGRVYVVTGFNEEQVKSHLNGRAECVTQREQLGTGCTERQPELRERLAQALAELGGRGRAFRAGTFHVERRA